MLFQSKSYPSIQTLSCGNILALKLFLILILRQLVDRFLLKSKKCPRQWFGVWWTRVESNLSPTSCHKKTHWINVSGIKWPESNMQRMRNMIIKWLASTIGTLRVNRPKVTRRITFLLCAKTGCIITSWKLEYDSISVDRKLDNNRTIPDWLFVIVL